MYPYKGKFNIKRDPEEKVNKLYPYAGGNVALTLQPSQMSIEEFCEDQHKGVKYTVDGDGTALVPEGRLELGDGNGSTLIYFLGLAFS